MAIKDFDKIVREERIAVLGGEQIDVSKIPSRVTLEIAKAKESVDKVSDEEGFMRAVELVSMACKPSNSKVTTEWLFDNTDFETLLDFMDYVMEPVKRRVEEEERKQAEAYQKKIEMLKIGQK